MRWCVVVDGVRVREAPDNVSEEYNALFHAARTECDAVVCTAADFLTRAATPWDAVVLFEPVYIPTLVRSQIMALLTKSTVLVVWVDDVYQTPHNIRWTASVHADGIVGPYAEKLVGIGQASALPHCAADVYCDTPLPTIPRKSGCVLTGQSSDELYPERAALRAAAPPWLVTAPQPKYGDDCVQRTPPAEVIRLLDAHTCAYVGGGRHFALVTKHFEYAARGVVVITDAVTAEKARAYGLEFESACNVADVERIVNTVLPGEREERNREQVLKVHRPWQRVQALVQVLEHCRQRKQSRT